MWCVRKGNQVTKIINGAQAITIDEIQHPAAIFRAWDKHQLANIGVFPLEIQHQDSEFYTYRGERYDIQSEKVVRVWDTVTPKPMDELREKHTDSTAQSALSLLKATDWYVIRKTETDEAIPDDVATYRAAVRAAEKKITKAIAAKKTVTGLKNMFVAPDDGNAPMHDWPDPLE